jgi:hypothetical protein
VLFDPQVARELGIVAPYLLDEALGVLATDECFDSVAQPEVGLEGVVDDGVGDHRFRMMNERSNAAVLVRLAAFLCEQRRDAVGEIRTECCLEPATIPLGELSDEALGEIAANCCFEAVEGGYAIVLPPMQLLYVYAQPKR